MKPLLLSRISIMKKRASKSKALSPGFHVVALGGGTGLSTLLRGLKELVIRRTDDRATAQRPIADLAAIVTVTDDGGSSGRLRRENRILPPGDIRNCMVALSKDEALLGRLFQYRFHAGRGLVGHNFGNLFLAALTHVTGDFTEAINVRERGEEKISEIVADEAAAGVKTILEEAAEKSFIL